MSQPDASLARTLLAGGDRRSVGRADEVAALVLAGKLEFGVVFAAMFDADPVVQMRAADAVEKVSARQPARLRPHKADFLAGLPGFRRPEMRWHAAQMLPRLGVTTAERDMLALPALREYLRDPSRLVRTFALQSLSDFATADAALRPRVSTLLRRARRDGSPAVQARCRRLLARWPVPPSEK